MRREAAGQLDRAILNLRRLMVKPPAASLPIPELGHSVDFAKVHALLSISEADGPCTVKDVAAALGLDHSTASRLLGDAESDGLVRRHADPADRRRTIVQLTSKGRTVVRVSSNTRCSVIEGVFADWSVEDLSTLTEMLQRMARTFSDRAPGVIASLDRETAGGPQTSRSGA